MLTHLSRPKLLILDRIGDRGDSFERGR